jgi:hypothetical protein
VEVTVLVHRDGLVYEMPIDKQSNVSRVYSNCSPASTFAPSERAPDVVPEFENVAEKNGWMDGAPGKRLVPIYWPFKNRAH